MRFKLDPLFPMESILPENQGACPRPIPCGPGRASPLRSPPPTQSVATKGRRAKPEEAFFQKQAPAALMSHSLYGVPTSVALAQAALETGFGRHAPGNNFFGIKGEGPAGSQRLRTWEFRKGRRIAAYATFRKYHTPLESFLDYGRLILDHPLWKQALQHGYSPRQFISTLQSGDLKYATDPAYVQKVLAIIEDHGLEKYDQPPPRDGVHKETP